MSEHNSDREKLLASNIDNDKDFYTININEMNNNIDNKLNYALKTLHETQNVGINILNNLDDQRTQILNMKNKTEHINNNITKSNNILNKIKKTYEQNKCMGIIIIIVAIIIITLIVILVVTK
jgi:hypothetical protein